MKRTLIAGIGNIFLGDDAFGCEVINELLRCKLPPDVLVKDFGIRSYDLAYAMTEGYDNVILVDAVPGGEPPGTVYLIEPDLEGIEKLAPAFPDAHSLNPVSVLRLVGSLGTFNGKLFLIGCEPLVLDCDNGQIGLSEPVNRAVPQAIQMIESLIRNSFDLTKTTVGPVPA